MAVDQHDGSDAALQLTGAVLAACGRAGVPVREHAARLVKKAVVGTGGAEKAQVQAMLKVLLPGAAIAGPDAADALAIAICHAHHTQSSTRLQDALRRAAG